jgi:hypothetical protein
MISASLCGVGSPEFVEGKTDGGMRSEGGQLGVVSRGMRSKASLRVAARDSCRAAVATSTSDPTSQAARRKESAWGTMNMGDFKIGLAIMPASESEDTRSASFGQAPSRAQDLRALSSVAVLDPRSEQHEGYVNERQYQNDPD